MQRLCRYTQNILSRRQEFLNILSNKPVEQNQDEKRKVNYAKRKQETAVLVALFASIKALRNIFMHQNVAHTTTWVL